MRAAPLCVCVFARARARAHTHARTHARTHALVRARTQTQTHTHTQNWTKTFAIRYAPGPGEYEPAQWAADTRLWMATQHGDPAEVGR